MPLFHVDVFLHCAFSRKLSPTLKRSIQGVLKELPPALKRKKLKGRKPPYYINVSIVTPAQIQRLNRTYRGKNRPTDVLSFSTLDLPPLPSVQSDIGDLILCWKVIQKQAKENGVSEVEELVRMAVHGTLHLFGYDHEKSAKEAKKMFAIQERLVERISKSFPDRGDRILFRRLARGK